MKKIIKKAKINSKEKNQYGITLIALVVTIVVLLILAGITINMLFSNGGIFDIANQSKIEYEIGALKDRINNVIADWSIERLTKPGITVDDLWDKMVATDIISNPVEDYVEGPEKQGENDVYQVTTNEGYVVEVIISPDGNVSIGDVVKGDSLPPKIVSVETDAGTNNIQVTVTMSRWENGTISYYYKKDGEADTSYQAFKENTTELTANIEGLEQNEVYNIRIVAENENGSTEKVVNERTGELKTGTISQKGETVWSNGTAAIELETTETGLTIKYQIDGTEGQWLDYEGPITGLNHNQTIYAVITDGTNQSGYTTINILDEEEPQLAQINLNGTNTTTTGSVKATVTHTDNESGVDIENCRWVYNTNPSSIGTETSSYPNTFNSNGETITLSASNPGIYYLHVLTQDVAGNKIETISEGITVTQLMTGITVSPTSVTLEEGNTQLLTVNITPSNASNKTVSWSSNNVNIATVSSEGLVTAKKAGTTTITVKANDGSNVQATCSVTVNLPLPTIEETLKAGDYVKYVDGTGVTRKCVVLYDSNSNYGIQIITMETVEDVTLGEASRNTITSKTMDDYNNVIKILNNATSKYLNTDYAESVRCVGTVPNNPSYDGAGMFTMTESWFSSYNGRFKDTDTNYLSDYNHLSSLNILIIDNYYWLASRIVGDSSSSPNFNVRIVFVNGLNQYNLCVLRSGINVNESNSVTNGLRPVFKLKTGIKVTGGTGTEQNPYTLDT